MVALAGGWQVYRDYVFWGLFVLVLIGVAGTLIRDSLRRKKREAEEARLRAAQPPAPAVPPHLVPAPHPEAAFDATATRVHVRSAPVATHAVLADRGAAELPSAAVPKLVCVGGTLKDRSFPVTAAGIKVGRKPDNDIVITDPRASNHHAWVGIVEHKVVLRDLGSTNGTFLNAQIDAPVSEAVLAPGDTIFFGGHGRDQFRFVVD